MTAWKWGRLDGWRRIIARNEWFGTKAALELGRLVSRKPGPRVVFSYSYTAGPVFECAKALGCRTVLGQIDPGPVEERLVSQLAAEHPELARGWQPSGQEYWDRWRHELALTDLIVVNSTWSLECLVKEGVSQDKICVVPLAFEPPAAAQGYVRSYPRVFSPSRPLRVLFLGQVNLRKGAVPLMEAIRKLEFAPAEFWIVGPESVTVPDDLRHKAGVKWFGPVPRGRAAQFFREADVFLLPTISDGFGLTQLEAQAWRLPVIASKFCGDVVEHRRNGFLLESVTVEAIVKAINELLVNPGRLAEMASNSGVADRFSLAAVGKSLTSLA